MGTVLNSAPRIETVPLLNCPVACKAATDHLEGLLNFVEATLNCKNRWRSGARSGAAVAKRKSTEWKAKVGEGRFTY